jgi:hypothetical protein
LKRGNLTCGNDIMERIILLLVIVISGECIKAQNQDTSIVININKTGSERIWIVKAFFQDEKKLWISPFKNFDKSIGYWAPVIGATILSISMDEKIYSEIKSMESKHKWISGISPVITLGGDNITAISTCTLFYLGGLLFHDDKAKQTGLMAAEAMAHAGIIVAFGKILTGRQRPSYEHGNDHWNFFPKSLRQYNSNYLKSGYDAFPSGHTIVAWSVATVIAKQYRDYKIVPVICYTLATGVGLSRITEDTHWMSDVIMGAALGYSIGRFIVRERASTQLTILPVTDGKSVMISSYIEF